MNDLAAVDPFKDMKAWHGEKFPRVMQDLLVGTIVLQVQTFSNGHGDPEKLNDDVQNLWMIYSMFGIVDCCTKEKAKQAA